MAVGFAVGAGVGLGSVVAVGTAVAAGAGVGGDTGVVAVGTAVATSSGVAFDTCVGALVGVSVAFWPGDTGPGVIETEAVGAPMSAGGGAVARGAAPQAKTSPNIAGKTMIEIARNKIALLMATPVPPIK